MERPKPQYLLRLAQRFWILVVVMTAAGFLAGSAAALLSHTTYTAHSLLYVSARDDNNASAAYQGNLLSQQRVRSYTELVASPRVARDVKAELHLPEEVQPISRHLSATSALDSVIIDLAAESSTPQDAAALARAASRSLIALVDQLERPEAPGAGPAVEVSVVQDAGPPSAASSTPKVVFVLLGGLLGLICGLTAAAIWRRLRSTVLDATDLESASNEPVLGVVSRDRRNEVVNLVQEADMQSIRYEELRHVRSSLRFYNLDNEPFVLEITSSLAGEGKTTMSIDLARVFASSGLRVLVIDADLRRPSTAESLGLEAGVGLSTALTGRLDLSSATQYSRAGGFHLLASGELPPNPNELVSSRRMKELLAEARAHYDLVVIDTPPTLPVPDSVALAPLVDGIVVLCKYNATTASQVAATFSALLGVGGRVLGSVLTLGPRNTGAGGYGNYRSNTYKTSGRTANDDWSDEAGDAVTDEYRSRPTPQPRSRTS